MKDIKKLIRCIKWFFIIKNHEGWKLKNISFRKTNLHYYELFSDGVSTGYGFYSDCIEFD